MRRYLSIILVVVPFSAACSSAPDTAGGSSDALVGQYDAVKITQMDDSKCHEYNCGLASAAMMRAVMTGDSSEWPCSNTNASCANGKANATAKKMREYYNAIHVHNGSFEDNASYCNTSSTKGTNANGVADTLHHVHESNKGWPSDNGPNLSSECAQNPAACTSSMDGKTMSICEFQKRLSPKGGSCGGPTFFGGYVAAVRGNADHNGGKGSPCYGGPNATSDHFIFVHDYDASTDTFTVYDPACSNVKEGAWSSSDLLGWANGGAGVLTGFVYGRGDQHKAAQPPPPPCTHESDDVFCASQQKNCGTVTGTDNCGSERTVNDCGSCGGSNTCGGGGQENVCGYGVYDDSQDFPAAPWLTGTIHNDGLCARAHVASGEVRMTTCTETDQNQNWRRTDSRQLQNVGSSTCAQASSTTKAGVVSHATCSASTSQDWAMTSVEIVQGTTGNCLSIPYGNYTDGAPVRYRSCSDKDNQKFTYDLASETISPASATNLCFDASGANVVLRACNGSAGQKWNDAHRGFVSRATSQCLAVEGGPNAATPANVQVQACADTEDQMWGMRGALRLNASTNLCLKAAPSGQQMVTAACDANDPLQKMTVWSQP